MCDQFPYEGRDKWGHDERPGQRGTAPVGDERGAEWNAARVEAVDYDGHGDEPNVFIQWKGTDVCLDFWCECGELGHFDGYFAYAIRCPACGAVWAMPSTIYPRRLTDAEIAAWPSAGPVDVEIDSTSSGSTDVRSEPTEGNRT